MATKRKTGNDYEIELHEAEIKVKQIEAQIISRARILCKQHSDVQIGWCLSDAGPNVPQYSGSVVRDDMTVHEALYYIKAIETELANRHPHKQTKIEFAPEITKPSECPHRSCVADIYFCEHPSMVKRYCTWTTEFPDGCPIKKK